MSILKMLMLPLVLTACVATIDREATDRSSSISHLSSRLTSPDDIVMVVAHRGCWKSAPENSLAAIEDCIAIGVDMVELDVARTRDGMLVLLHDPTVDRTTDGVGRVADLTWDEVRSLRLRDGRGGKDATITGYRIPTLEEVLATARGRILINVDAKAEVYEDVSQVLVRLEMTDHVLMKIAARPDDERLRSTDLFRKVYFMPVLYDTWGEGPLSSLVPAYEDLSPVAYEVVFAQEEWFVRGLPALRQTNARIWVNLLELRHAAGHTDAVAMEDPDDHWGRLLAMGVNMIQTDEPAMLIEYLKGLGRR